jgi:hypothetical protein
VPGPEDGALRGSEDWRGTAPWPALVNDAPRKPGRPKSTPSVIVSVRIPVPVYDEYCKRAVRAEKTVRLVMIEALVRQALHHAEASDEPMELPLVVTALERLLKACRPRTVSDAPAGSR